VRALLDAVAVLAEADIAGAPVAGRLAEVRQLWPALCAAQAQLLRRVADLHRVGAAAGDGFVSTTAWVRGRLHVDGGRAGLLVRTGAGLDQRAQTAAALADGAISIEHAAAIVDAATDLGEQVLTDAVEKVLVDFARDHPPAELRRLIRQIKLALLDDDDAAERQVRLHQGRWLNASRTFEGMVHIEGMLDPVAGAQILAALAAFTPGPDPDGPAGRTARQRRADAFTDICTTALASKARGGDGADTPHITLTVSWETLRGALADLHQQPPPDSPNQSDSRDPDRTDSAEAGEPKADTSGEPTAPTKPTTAASTTGADGTADADGPDAEVGTGSWPRWLGPPPPVAAQGEADRVSDVLAGLGDPLRPGGAALLGHPGEPICAETARRLACDAGIIPVLLGSRSQPLDIGRLTRVVPAALRRAVELRDKTCRFPGCDRPPNWCDCHHLKHWAHGGATCLANLILLCGFHHGLVHEYGWRLQLHPDTGDVSATRPDGSAYDLISRHDQLNSSRAGPSP
jgi:hypothetical protein